MKTTRIIAILAAALLFIAALSSCSNLPAESFDTSGRFDYINSNMKKYVALDESLYKNTTVTLPSYLDGSEDAVQEYIDLLLKQNSKSTGEKITDRAIQNGDVVALYYEGWLDGEKFEGGSNMDDKTPYSLTIGSGTFIPGFEEGLVGLVPADTSKDKLAELHLTFPADYHSADLAGKAVTFKVYVEYIDVYAPAEYTNEFITKTLGYTTAATDVKADFEKYLKDDYLPSMKDSEIANAIWADMTEGAVIKKYPQGEIEFFAKSYEEQYKQYYQYYSSMFSSYEEFMKAYLGTNWKADLEEQCKIDVEQNLIFHYIAQKEGLTITETDYKNAVQYYIDYYASQGTTLSEADVESYFGERMVKEQALWDKVSKLLIENCTVVFE